MNRTDVDWSDGVWIVDGRSFESLCEATDYLDWLENRRARRMGEWLIDVVAAAAFVGALAISWFVERRFGQ